MPCISGNGPFGYDDSDYRRARKEADKLTQMLCSLLGKLEAKNKISDFVETDTRIDKWWREHKKQDAERLKQEKAARKLTKARKVALAKLTPKERKLLQI